MPNVRHLRALQASDAAATWSSLSKAAQDLNVTHGAVSRQIKQLEQYLGVTLLRRLPGGVQLTGAGARLHLATQQASAALEQGIDATRRPPRRRSITISLSFWLAIKWLVPKLQDFRDRCPSLSVYLDTDDRYVDCADKDADAALRYGSDPGTALYAQRLRDERLIVVAAPSVASAAPIAPDAITKLPLLHDQFPPYWDTWANAGGLDAPNVQSRSSAFPDSAVLIAAAIDGQGAILVRHLLVADDVEAGRLVRLSDVSVQQDRGLYLVCRDGDPRSSPSSNLCLWLSEVCVQA